MTEQTLPPGSADVDTTADVCSVQRSADGVALHFGRRVAVDADGAVTAALQHRVLLVASGAERLQDMLTALLQEPAA